MDCNFARDFFYLAALFIGAGTGCLLNRFKRTITFRLRNRCTTAALCLFSLSAAALIAAIVFSNWMVFAEASFYLPFCFLIIIAALVFRFPMTAGFPLVLITGVFLVWMGSAYLRFPALDGIGQAQLTRDGNGRVSVKFPSAPDTPLSLESSPEFLEFRAFRCSFAKNFPLVGGVNRGIITGILGNGEFLYVDTRVRSRSGRGLLSLSFIEVSGRLDTKRLAPGVDITVLSEDSSLVFAQGR